MTDPESSAATLEKLRAENDALDDQIKLLVQTEQRLYRSQNELDRQLSRIQRLSELSLLLSGQETPAPILRATGDMLADTFDVDGVLHVQLGHAEVTVETLGQRPGPPAAPGHDVAQLLAGLGLTVASMPDQVAPPVRRWLLPPDRADLGGVLLSLPLRPMGAAPGLLLAWKSEGQRASFHREALVPRHVPYLQLLATHVVRALETAALTARLRERGEELADSNAKLKASLTRLENTQERLLRAQKLEAIGRLAGGVAHDFNNILTVISTHAGLLRRTLAEGSEARSDVEQIKAACDRAAKLTQQLLAFGRRQTQRREAVDLNAATMDMSRMLGRLAGERVSLQLRLDPAVSPVHVDRAQLEQIIVNLVVNARDAMPDGGVITVGTRRPRFEDAPDSMDVADLRGHVVLTVSDTGEGMDARTRAQVFEPFFTTKPPGQGTGMGLATVYGTVKQNNGHISIDTRPGQGTSFTILLPASETVPPRTTRRRARPNPHAPTILLAEDEDAIRRIAVRVLESEGFEVLDARNGVEAMALVEEKDREIDLLLTDVVMPHMDGVTLAEELAARYEHLPVLFMSGHAFDMLDARGLSGPRHFLQKPFDPARLTLLVRQTLAEAAEG